MNYNKNNTNHNNTKLLLALVGQLALACALSGCSYPRSTSTETTDQADYNTESTNTQTLDSSDMFTDRDKEIGYDADNAISITLADDATHCDDPSVTIDANTITLSAAGTYLLLGTLSNGQIIVDAPEDAKLQLVLDNTNINCDTSAAIYVRQADKVFVTLASGSENTLSVSGSYAAIDDNNIDAALFSKEDLTLNGSGTLTVNAAYGHGIVSKDDLVITSGTYHITAEKHALAGKDSVRIADGVFDLTAGTDGIHADSDLTIANGSIDITQSYEGLEGMTITIDGGDIRIVADDDGLNAAGDGQTPDTQTQSESTNTDPPADIDMTPPNMENKDNSMTPPDMEHNDSNMTPPDMEHNDNSMTPPDMEHNDSSMTPPERPDGSFDKIGGMGGGFDKANDYNFITINGGTLYINAQGDGIDSNGDLTVNGGEIYIDGPTSGGNGALDYAGDATINNGIVVAVGSSGMAMNFGTASTQNSLLTTVAQRNISGDLALTDADGNTIITYSPQKSYNSVVISCPELSSDETYTLTAGDTTTDVTLSNTH